MTRAAFCTARNVVLVLYLAIATAYGVVNPAFESPDELLHFEYVESLLRTGHLPIAVVGTGPREEMLTEDFQAPLYYTAGALLTAWLPPGRPAHELIERNPFWAWRIGEVGVDNKAQFLHGPEQAFPWDDLWLRLHLLRLFSVFLGSIAVWQTGEFALLIWPRRYETALLAMGFIAFLPQFVYLSSSVTNDVAVVAFSALSAVALGRLLRSLSRNSFDMRGALLLGLFLGCGILAEVSMLSAGVVALGILFLYLLANRRSTPRPSWGNLGLAGLTSAAIAVPYLVRNWLVYGEATGLRRMDEIWGRREPPLTLGETLRESPNMWTSFWGRFGYGQIPVPNAIYIACLVMTAIALVGLALVMVRKARGISPASKWPDGIPWGEGRLWLFVYAGLLAMTLIIALIRYAGISPTGSFGRESFAALPADAVLLAGGWMGVCAAVRRPSLALTVPSALLVFSVWALATILRPAYVLPTRAFATLGGSISEQAGLRVGDVATLTRVKLLKPTLTPGEDALVEVEWLPLRQTATPLIFFARLVGPSNTLLADRSSYPGLGRTSTTFWKPGDVFTDLLRVPVDADGGRAAAPAQVRLWVGLYDRSAGTILPASLWPSGDSVPGIVAEGRLPAPHRQKTADSGPAMARFGDQIELSAAHFPAALQPGAVAHVNLQWTVLSPLTDDCKLFIHLTPTDQTQPVAQVDEPIMCDRYPAHLWTAGEVFEDRHQISIPATLAPGTYRLLIGVYHEGPEWARLPVVCPAGSVQEGAFVLGAVKVVAATP